MFDRLAVIAELKRVFLAKKQLRHDVEAQIREVADWANAPRLAMLPGIAPIIGTAVAATLSSISLAGSSPIFSSTSTITVPATAIAGDVAIIFDQTYGSGPSVTPSGYTQIATNNNGFNNFFRIYGKVLTGGDAGATVTGASDTYMGKILYLIRGNVAIASFISSTWVHEVTNSDPAGQTVSASGVQTPLVVLGIAASAGSTTSLSNSPTFDAINNSTFHWLSGSDGTQTGYKIYNSSPANHTVDAGTAGNYTRLSSGYVRFT